MRPVVTRLVALIVAIELIYVGYIYFDRKVPSFSSHRPVSQQGASHEAKRFLSAIKEFHPSKGAGDVPPLTHHKLSMHDDYDKFNSYSVPATLENLKDYLIVEDSWRSSLRELHAKVVKSIPRHTSEKNDETGIVMTGGGKIFGQTLVGIRYYRKFHPDYPIELWMARSEYEPYYCETLFPQENVTCMVMEEYYGDELEGFDYMGYPLKSLALAGSRFSHIYFCDVDSFLLGSIEEVMGSELYTNTGFVGWPDYWARVTAPDYYDIAGSINIDEVDPKLPLTDFPRGVPYRTSSETGQMVINKRSHFDSLLLAVYYNLNGNNYYFPLLSQANDIHGFGDKESFISAVYSLGHEAYQVNSTVITFGQHYPSGFSGRAIAQIDPVDDYKTYHIDHKDHDSTKIFSVHCTTMKLDPFKLFCDEPEENGTRPNRYLTPVRGLGSKPDVINRVGFDLELRLFEVVEEVLCEWVLDNKPRFANGEDPQRTCDRAKGYLEWLRKN